ncbi:hypothetical protein D3C87_1174010 [compost metagenome]
MNLLDRVDEVREPLQREVLALHRHDHAMRGAEAVQRQQRQRWRAVDQHEVILGIHLGQRLLEAALTLVQLDQFHLGTGQFAVGGYHVVAARLRTLPRLLHRRQPHQYLIHAVFERLLVDAGTHRGIALRVEVHQQHALPLRSQPGGQIHRGGGLAHTALLIGDHEYLGHRRLLLLSACRRREAGLC